MARSAAETVAMPGVRSRQKLQRVFLKDHLAMATLAVEVARRALGENKGTIIGDYLRSLVDDLESDRTQLRELARRADVVPERVREGLAWAGEKVGRLKLNGRLLGYSPLSRAYEFETLLALSAQRLATWRVLERQAKVDRRFEGFDFASRIAAAEAAKVGIEQHYTMAVDQAF